MTAPVPEPRPFPWDEAMAFGLGVLRLSPTEFWAMTLPELAAAARGALRAGGDAHPLERNALDDLMRRFPDAVHPDDGDPDHARL